MKTVISIALWLLAAVARIALVVLGWFFVPLSLLGNGRYVTAPVWRMWIHVENTPEEYETSLWKTYVWWAWRNPTIGLAGVWRQPVPEIKPNPDQIVRDPNLLDSSADRWMQHGWYWEYWYLRKISLGKYKFFEFRIGWKFVDGNEHFYPTLQLGPRSS